MSCTHQPSANPRHVCDDGACVCVKCGRPFTTDDLPPATPQDPKRDVAGEIRLKREASRLTWRDAEDLIAFADARTHPGPVRQFADRDFGRDAAEEVADLSNYLTWWAQRTLEPGELYEAILEALVSSIDAWHKLQRARALERG